MQWTDLMKNKFFITDLGENQTTELDGNTEILGRYAVWSPMTGSNSHQIIEVSEAIEPLIEKYNVPSERICILQKN